MFDYRLIYLLFHRLIIIIIIIHIICIVERILFCHFRELFYYLCINSSSDLFIDFILFYLDIRKVQARSRRVV